MGPTPVMNLLKENALPASIPATAPSQKMHGSYARDVYAAHYDNGSVVSQPSAQNRHSAYATAARTAAPQPQTVGDLASVAQPPVSGLQPSKPFPGYGQSFA